MANIAQFYSKNVALACFWTPGCPLNDRSIIKIKDPPILIGVQITKHVIIEFFNSSQLVTDQGATGAVVYELVVSPWNNFEPSQNKSVWYVTYGKGAFCSGSGAT